MTQLLALAQKITRSEGLRQSGLTVVGNTLSTGLSAIALLLISRALGPTSFGQFSVGFAIIIMLNKFNDMGLNAAMIKYAGASESQDERLAIFSFAARIKLFLSIAIIVVGIIFTPWLDSILKFGSPTILYLSFGLSIVSSWYEQLLTMLQTMHRFAQAVLINTIQATTKLIGIGFLVSLNLGASLPVFIWYMASPVVSIMFSHKLLPASVSLFSISDRLSIKTKSLIIQMARHSALGFVAAGIIENIDILFVQKYLTAYETGLLGGVSRIAMMITLVAYSVGNVLYPRVARYKSRQHLIPYFKKAILTAFAAIAAFILFIPFARLSVVLTIGQEYLPGVNVLYLLAASAFLTVATIPFLALFYTFKADWYFSVSGVIQLIIILAGNGIYVPIYGLEAAAITRLVARLVLFAFTTVAAYTVLRKHLNDQKTT